MSNEKKKLVDRVHRGFFVLPSDVGMIVNHDKDPYQVLQSDLVWPHK